MAGIYIHIPFCRKRCSYCDFYTEVAPQLAQNLVDSLISEITLRKNYLENASIKTIYFGGGTPSILSKKQFEDIFNTIFNLFTVESNAEITLEANPDDLSEQYLNELSTLPFNRISIGIQSFDDTDLNRINRRHTGNEAIIAVKNAQKAGFQNISIDLIYGLPYQTLDLWEKQLNIALDLNIQHISAYGLTYEEGTSLWMQREKGKITATDDDTMNKMYERLLELSTSNGFEAYEISNFSIPGYRSKHNSAYWNQEPYLGIGPSAHSYNIDSRQWNISSIKKYIEAINNGLRYFENETLSFYDKYNDYIMVSLRTAEGIDLTKIETLFGKNMLEYCMKNIQQFLDSNKVKQVENALILTTKGVEISNIILIQLMKV